MSISLKNITSADTISSMVDKINFNFDQILLNGGGIEGPKGERGYPGMQGVLGRQGERGETGDSGRRGTLWFKLPVENITAALTNGFTDSDITAMGGDVMSGDIVVSTTIDTSATESNGDDVASKLYKVIEDSSVSEESGLKPEFFANFVPTEFFEEYKPNGVGEHSLIRTTASGSGFRGLILNDYHGNINLTNNLLTSIIRNNAAIVYTEANSEENSEGSPNTGLVFIKDGDLYEQLGDYPRINYIKSNNNINQLNINAPSEDQSINISARGNLTLSGNNFKCRIKSNFEVFVKESDNSEKFTYIKTEKDSNDKQNIYLSADSIKICKLVDDTPSNLLTINTPDANTCKIQIHKNVTRIDAGASFYVTSSYTGNNHKHINLENGNLELFPYSIANSIRIGSWDPNSMGGSHDYSFGLYAQYKDVRIASCNAPGRSEIILNNYFTPGGNIQIKTNDYFSTLTSNISEEFGPALININPNGGSTYSLDSIKYTTWASWLSISEQSSGSYYYARYNAYNNLHILTLIQPKSIFAGSSTFEGAGTHSTIVNNNKIVYNYTKIGNVVHCNFHGIVNPYFITAAPDQGSKYINKKSSLCCYNDNYFSPAQNRINRWTLGTHSNNNTRVLIDVFPPIMEITLHYSSSGGDGLLHTNIKDLAGRLTFSCNGNIADYVLEYEDDKLTEYGTNNPVYIVPSLYARKFKNNGDLNAEKFPTAPSVRDYRTLIMNGSVASSTATNNDSQAEIYGDFSYVIDVDEMHHHSRRDDEYASTTNDGGSGGNSGTSGSDASTGNASAGNNTGSGGNGGGGNGNEHQAGAQDFGTPGE